MRANHPPAVEISKVKNDGSLPPFLNLAHRHFQKSLPHITPGQKRATLTINVDLLDLIVPTPILNRIESIEVTYEKP